MGLDLKVLVTRTPQSKMKNLYEDYNLSYRFSCSTTHLKLEYSLRLKIKRNDWLLAARVRKQPTIAFYFDSETVLKFYNLEARSTQCK